MVKDWLGLSCEKQVTQARLGCCCGLTPWVAKHHAADHSLSHSVGWGTSKGRIKARKFGDQDKTI